MLDARATHAAGRSPAVDAGIAGRPRRVVLSGCAALALALHGVSLGAATNSTPGIGTAGSGALATALLLHALAPEPAATIDVGAPAEEPAVASPERWPRRAPPSVLPMQSQSATSEKACARFRKLEMLMTAAPALAAADTASVVRDASATAPRRVAEATSSSTEHPAASAPAAPAASIVPGTPPLLAPGEAPPPTYRARLPPKATLRYEVRRGVLRGTGEIRWRPAGEQYQLVLEARLAGLTLLVQTSEGSIGATGLMPVRFLDRRARRPTQAANLHRDTGTVTFSGPPVEWPLLPGTQDRLSWMIQLAGIAAAQPQLLVEGARITMAVVGARGEAAVWTLRYAGRETLESVWGTVQAVKLVRDGRSASDTGAEIWLDPARDYFPARAALLNGSGEPEYDLLLERVETPP
jgi:Protein of unknown function (DUF3108)